MNSPNWLPRNETKRERERERKRGDQQRSDNKNSYETNNCCIFQPAFGCCALQTLVEICFLNDVCAKKLKRQLFGVDVDAMRTALSKANIPYIMTSQLSALTGGLSFKKAKSNYWGYGPRTLNILSQYRYARVTGLAFMKSMWSKFAFIIS